VPNLRDFERRLGGLVEGLFSKTFRSGVQPVELAKRLIKEMDAGRTVGVTEVWAPNHFSFHLSAEDAERLEQAEAAMAAELKNVIRENASERGWGLVGPPEVEFLVDDRLRKGDFSCEGSLVEGAEKIEPVAPAAPSDASLVVHEDGSAHTVALTGESVTIGRLPDCDIVLKDKGASRRHAQIRTEGGVSTLTDLGSTNGTRLNGQMVQSRRLEDGDRIVIGATVLEYRRS
jgi:FhaA, N-terminal domain/FHA domain